jgi:anti-sigma-K factor RskA
MSDQPIDFSSIDPKRNRARWESMVHSVLERAEATQKRVQFWHQLVSWTKPALAVAAAVAMLCLIGVVITHHGSVHQTSQVEPALVVASWAAGEEMPNTASILRVLGEDYVKE